MRKGGLKASAGQTVLFKEWVKASKTKTANKRVINHASRIGAAVAKVIKKVTPKKRFSRRLSPRTRPSKTYQGVASQRGEAVSWPRI